VSATAQADVWIWEYSTLDGHTIYTTSCEVRNIEIGDNN
jgi:hypothetical protein